MKVKHLIVLVISLLLYSCSKCPETQEVDMFVDDFSKSFFPYNGNETLIFVNQNNDTLTLIGQGLEHSYYVKSDGFEKGSGKTCNTYVKHLEKFELSFSGETNNGENTHLYLKLGTYSSYRQTAAKNQSLNGYIQNESEGLIDTFNTVSGARYRTGDFRVNFDYIDNIYYPDSTITINGIQYSDLILGNEISALENGLVHEIFARDKGLVYFKSPVGNEWILLP